MTCGVSKIFSHDNLVALCMKMLSSVQDWDVIIVESAKRNGKFASNLDSKLAPWSDNVAVPFNHRDYARYCRGSLRREVVHD